MHSGTIPGTELKNVTTPVNTGAPTPMHKKVLFVIDTLQTGGAEQSLFANAIRFKTMQPVVCHLYAGDLLKQKFTAYNVPVYSVGLKKKYGFTEAYKQLKAIVQKEQPDIIVAYLTRSEIIARLVGRFSHIPVIGTFVSELYSDTYNTALSAKAKMAVSFFKWANKTTARFCKGFVANSEEVKRSNAKALGIALNKIEVINRGRDSNLFRFHVPQAASGKPLRFLNVGRLVPVKGQRDLIQAFAAFLPACPDAELHIAGEGPARESLTALIDELGLQHNVELLGSQDIPRIINGYDCFVFPSHSEGFSGAVVEAMFAGLPVLASDIAVNKEVITHLETGYFFEKGSVESIKQALLWYKDNVAVANTFAVKANEHARQHFELDKIAGKLENYLLNLIIVKN
ncbi:glycosyltransferase [Niastella koreensis]|uniref:Glycosyl transferase group 1 n=2 Tax=Niastella koreensis TaxID=354356 RepID=G8TEZ4_NIAKG|nr:glycosyltransferase family 4 protein [Niastella koreensis]AEW01582.1 glycosyl transferase group 1 [Niastella koreensis GR20-10]OQP48297.1 glycosyltransferase [Niastella koreensis]